MSFWKAIGEFALFNFFSSLFSSNSKTASFSPKQPLSDQYNYDDSIDDLQGQIDDLEDRYNYDEDCYDEIRDEIDDLRDELDDMEYDRDLDEDW